MKAATPSRTSSVQDADPAAEKEFLIEPAAKNLFIVAVLFHNRAKQQGRDEPGLRKLAGFQACMAAVRLGGSV